MSDIRIADNAGPHTASMSKSPPPAIGSSLLLNVVKASGIQIDQEITRHRIKKRGN
jgi:hypothetical protein